MPVAVTSRYRNLPSLTVEQDGAQTTAIARRPQPAAPAAAVTHVLTGAENVEYLAWRFHGRSAAWWHIADANPLSFPLDWRAGQGVAVPGSSGLGRIVRTRRV